MSPEAVIAPFVVLNVIEVAPPSWNKTSPVSESITIPLLLSNVISSPNIVVSKSLSPNVRILPSVIKAISCATSALSKPVIFCALFI